MSSRIEINLESSSPVYKQLMEQIERKISDGSYPVGYLLPSMNELAADLDISKETVKKAYNLLRTKGVVDSRQGKGVYVSSPSKDSHPNVLLIFDKLSSYKQVLFSSFADRVSDAADITILLTNQNIDLFEYYLNENLDKFDYYVVTPHFPLDPESQRRVLKLLKRIPNRKLIIVDNWMRSLPGNYGAIYQNYDTDIYDGLMEGLDKLKKFSRMSVIALPSSLYWKQIRKSVEKFCKDNNIGEQFYTKITPDIVKKDEVYLILNSQFDTGLIQLVRYAREKNLSVGKDYYIISYNESPVNEIILNGLTTVSTDFAQMGRLVADMILSGKLGKVHCDFHMTRRSTF